MYPSVLHCPLYFSASFDVLGVLCIMQCILGIAVSLYFHWLFFIVICLTGGLNFSVLASGLSSSRTQTWLYSRSVSSEGYYFGQLVVAVALFNRKFRAS